MTEPLYIWLLILGYLAIGISTWGGVRNINKGAVPGEWMFLIFLWPVACLLFVFFALGKGMRWLFDEM